MFIKDHMNGFFKNQFGDILYTTFLPFIYYFFLFFFATVLDIQIFQII